MSISTVSRLAAENGLSSPRKRTPAVEVPEDSYDREQRKAVLDRMLHSIDKMVERGGLSSRQLKDLASAVKEVNASRSSLDTIPDPRETSFKRYRGEEAYDELLGVDANGAPKHLGIYFGVLDIETARERGDNEEAEERVRAACLEAGMEESEIDFDKMLSKIRTDFEEDIGDRQGRSQEEKKGEERSEEYLGEGLS